MYNKQLVTYITKKVRRGNSFESVKEELIRAGWSLKNIDAAYKCSMIPQKSGLSNLLHVEVPLMVNIFLILIFAAVFYGLFIYFRNPVYNYTINLASANSETKAETFTYGEQPALSDPVFFEKTKNQFINDKVNFIEVNLSEMTVKVYKNGNNALDLLIKTKGREGSWWKTLAGLYKINTKEPVHFSTMG
jgi:hypothetical protein